MSTVPPPASVPPRPGSGESASPYVLSHFRFGWWSLLAFLSLGIALEALHGFKIGWYLNVSTQTRRLLLTLAHAHGTLLGLVHIAFAVTAAHFPGWNGRARTWASASLKAATFLLPGGFLLGGLVIYQGDPGLGILLVPIGGLLLLLVALLCARGLRSGNLGGGDAA